MPRRILKGVVVSDKADKTLTVKVERRFSDPFFKKTVRSSKKYKTHDENNKFKVGDSVRIQECRPISKSKRWRVIEIVRRGDIAEISPADIGREIEEGKQDEVEEVGAALEEANEAADVVEEVES